MSWINSDTPLFSVIVISYPSPKKEIQLLNITSQQFVAHATTERFCSDRFLDLIWKEDEIAIKFELWWYSVNQMVRDAPSTFINDGMWSLNWYRCYSAPRHISVFMVKCHTGWCIGARRWPAICLLAWYIPNSLPRYVLGSLHKSSIPDDAYDCICFKLLGQCWFGYWPIECWAHSNYLKQNWLIVFLFNH